MAGATFRTADGVAVPAVTADEMREVDRVAVEEYGIDILQMMENAGRNLAAHARRLGERVTVAAGSGGNGGGGLACARHLHNRGVSVRVVLDRPVADLEGAAASQATTLAAMGVPLEVGPGSVGEADPDLVVDALVGYGLSGPLGGTAADVVAAVTETDAPVLSLDVPSGVDATTGDRPGPAVDPARTVTLALPKTGLAALDDLVLADIAIPGRVYRELGIDYESPFDEEYWVDIEAV